MGVPSCAHAAVGAEDEELGIEQAGGLPTHTGAPREAEEIAGRLGEEHLCGDVQSAVRAGGMHLHVSEDRGVAVEDLGVSELMRSGFGSL
jgi:hypothetical protein